MHCFHLLFLIFARILRAAISSGLYELFLFATDRLIHFYLYQCIPCYYLFINVIIVNIIGFDLTELF